MNKIVIKKKSSFRGLHLPENKITSEKLIEKMPLPDRVILPFQQNIGAPCECLVEKGDEVKTGQKIAESKSYISVPVHSSVSGRVKRIRKIYNQISSSIIDALEIEADGLDRWVGVEELFNINNSQDFGNLNKIIENLSKEEILNKIKEGGVVGLGGAAFPTHVKLNPPADKKIDTVILNGCECEPFITSDHRIMLEYGRQVLAGLYLITRTLSPDNIYIAIEDNKKDAIEYMAKLTVEMGYENLFKIVSLPSRYPMGAEKTLIKTISNRSVPMGGLPMDVGVVVNNVATARAVYDAVIEGKPLIEKVITVTGKFELPKNVLVRIGTPLIEVTGYCGRIDETANKVILGGPMMGNLIVDASFPVIKGINCILVQTDKSVEEQHCINCGSCVRICPMNLMPLIYVRNVKNKNFEACRDYYITNCIECGSCSYVCPARIPIVGYIKTGKDSLNKK